MEAEDATRRTRLANERTQLAWWRTGLTALAVGLGVGRVIPELDAELERWPYELLGAAFALYAVALFWFGSVRARAVDEALDRREFSAPHPTINTVFTVGGVVLAAATGLLVLLG